MRVDDAIVEGSRSVHESIVTGEPDHEHGRARGAYSQSPRTGCADGPSRSRRHHASSQSGPHAAPPHYWIVELTGPARRDEIHDSFRVAPRMALVRTRSRSDECGQIVSVNGRPIRPEHPPGPCRRPQPVLPSLGARLADARLAHPLGRPHLLARDAPNVLRQSALASGVDERVQHAHGFDARQP